MTPGSSKSTCRLRLSLLKAEIRYEVVMVEERKVVVKFLIPPSPLSDVVWAAKLIGLSRGYLGFSKVYEPPILSLTLSLSQ